MLVDTHCHVHSGDYELDAGAVVAAASTTGVTKLIVVGTDETDSKVAIDFASSRENVWASVGLHPHDAKLGQKTYNKLTKLVNKDVAAIGECGLDYYYSHSDKKDQASALHFQMSLASEHGLPMIFHVRDAFEDFWSIFDQYQDIQGVVHSFTAGQAELAATLSRGLLVGLNGIMTFTKNPEQLEVAKSIPQDSLVLETDAPFLTPAPFRGTINEPRRILEIAKFLSELRGESFEELAKATTNNAEKLFSI